METRARYMLIGAFMIAAIAGVFAFIYWLENSGGLGRQTAYRVEFDTPVYGLYPGSSVLYNGVQVGQVGKLTLDPTKPEQVMVDILVDSGLQLRDDTQVGIATQGLTGSAAITLTGGSPDAPLLQAKNGEPPLLIAPPNAGEDWMAAARSAFQSADDILSENRKSLKDAIDNIDTFSAVLAKNSGKVSGLIDGLAKLTGAGGAAKKPTVYSLPAAHDFPPPPAAKPSWQLLVPEPSALLSMSTEKISVIDENGSRSHLTGGQWSDNLTTIFAESVIQSFENAGYAKNVSRPADTLQTDFQLQIDLRAFGVKTDGARPMADIDFMAKILDSQGKIVGARAFKADAPLANMDAATVTKGIGSLFQTQLKALIPWCVQTIDAAPKPKPGDTAAPPDDMNMPDDSGMQP